MIFLRKGRRLVTLFNASCHITRSCVLLFLTSIQLYAIDSFGKLVGDSYARDVNTIIALAADGTKNKYYDTYSIGVHMEFVETQGATISRDIISDLPSILIFNKVIV